VSSGSKIEVVSRKLMNSKSKEANVNIESASGYLLLRRSCLLPPPTPDLLQSPIIDTWFL
jgi:hypothetical protein